MLEQSLELQRQDLGRAMGHAMFGPGVHAKSKMQNDLRSLTCPRPTGDRRPRRFLLYWRRVTRGDVLGAQRLNDCRPVPRARARHRYRKTGGGTAALLRPPLAAPFLSTLSALTSVSPQTPLTRSCGEPRSR